MDAVDSGDDPIPDRKRPIIYVIEYIRPNKGIHDWTPLLARPYFAEADAEKALSIWLRASSPELEFRMARYGRVE